MVGDCETAARLGCYGPIDWLGWPRFDTFFPRFVIVSRPIAPQLVLLSATFLALASIIDGLWARAAARVQLRTAFRLPRRGLVNRRRGGASIGTE